MVGPQPHRLMGLRLGANARMLAASAALPSAAAVRAVRADSRWRGLPRRTSAPACSDARCRTRQMAYIDAAGRAARDPEAFRDEAFGIAISGALRRELIEPDWRALLGPLATQASVVLDEAAIPGLKGRAESALCLQAAEPSTGLRTFSGRRHAAARQAGCATNQGDHRCLCVKRRRSSARRARMSGS